MTALSSASAPAAAQTAPTSGANGATSQPAASSAPSRSKQVAYSVGCWTFVVGKERTGRLGIALDKANKFEVEGKRLLADPANPKSNFESPHVEKFGQVMNLTRCDVAQPALKGNKPGILVKIDSLVGVDLNVKCPMPAARWSAWTAAERGTDPEAKKTEKNRIRKLYPDDLEIHKIGVRFVVPSADEGKQVRQNFRAAVLKIDEGCWIELHMHTQDRGPNCMLLGCVDGKLVWRDPRVSIEKTDLEEKID